MISYTSNVADISEEILKGFFVGWRTPLTPQQHLTILQNSYRIVLAIDSCTGCEVDADIPGKVVGFCNALSDDIQFAFIPMLEVLPEYQDRGIGSILMEKMLGQLTHLDCIDLTCDPEKQSFYAKFGMLKSHGMVVRRYLDRE